MARSESTILGRVVDSAQGSLSPELARHVLELDFPPADHDRMAALGEKAQLDTLTATEREELESYLLIGDFLAILQSKARRSLQRLDAA